MTNKEKFIEDFGFPPSNFRGCVYPFACPSPNCVDGEYDDYCVGCEYDDFWNKEYKGGVDKEWNEKEKTQ